MAEHLIPELDRNGLRRFGFTTGGIVAGLFGVVFPWLLEREWPLWPWLVLGVLGGLALVAPPALRPIYRGWMRFGQLASKITTPLILGIVFFLLIAPIAVVRRIAGANDMQRPFDKNAATYRVPSKGGDGSRLERPF